LDHLVFVEVEALVWELLRLVFIAFIVIGAVMLVRAWRTRPPRDEDA
jgi:hypothetical protein